MRPTMRLIVILSSLAFATGATAQQEPAQQEPAAAKPKSLLELLELLSLVYESTEDFAILELMMRQSIGTSLVGVQFLIGSLVPLLGLGWIAVHRPDRRLMELVAYVSSFLLLLQVFSVILQ